MTDKPRKTGREMFDESVAHKGLPDAGSKLSAEQLSFVTAHWPAGLAELMQTHGFGSYNKRRYQFLDPLPFVPLVDQLFLGDPDIDPKDVSVCAVEAFGVFILWSRKHFSMTLDVHKMELTATEIAKPEFTGPAHLMAALNKAPDPVLSVDPDNRARNVLPFEPQKINFYDPMNKPLFTSAVKTLGALEPGEIFGFTPPLAALNGAIPRQPMDRMVRQPAEHALAAAMDAAPLNLVRRVKGKQEIVRPIGRQ